MGKYTKRGGDLSGSRQGGSSHPNHTARLMLFATSLIWGFAFVAQRAGMAHVGPFTFNAARNGVAWVVLGALARPLRAVRGGGGVPPEGNAVPGRLKRARAGGVVCGLILFGGSTLQQFGIIHTAVANASFITTLYIVLVPLAGLLLGRRTSPAVFAAVALAAFGLYRMCVPKGFMVSLSRGDLLVLLCAFFFSAHILAIDAFSPRADGVWMSRVQFATAGTLSVVCMILFERPSIGGLLACWWPILYAGVMSSGAGYTLQVLGQRNTPPAVASLILSLESVFGALFGFVFLSETISARGLSGMALMFSATILAQLPASRGKTNAAG